MLGNQVAACVKVTRQDSVSARVGPWVAIMVAPRPRAEAPKKSSKPPGVEVLFQHLGQFPRQSRSATAAALTRAPPVISASYDELYLDRHQSFSPSLGPTTAPQACETPLPDELVELVQGHVSSLFLDVFPSPRLISYSRALATSFEGFQPVRRRPRDEVALTGNASRWGLE